MGRGYVDVTVLGLVGGAPAQGWGGDTARGHAADTPRSYQCKYRPLALAFLRNAVERRSAAELRRIPQVRRGEFRKTQTQGPKASRSLLPELAATTMTTHANIYPTFTIKDLAKALGSVRKPGAACAHGSLV